MLSALLLTHLLYTTTTQSNDRGRIGNKVQHAVQVATTSKTIAIGFHVRYKNLIVFEL